MMVRLHWWILSVSKAKRTIGIKLCWLLNNHGQVAAKKEPGRICDKHVICRQDNVMVP